MAISQVGRLPWSITRGGAIILRYEDVEDAETRRFLRKLVVDGWITAHERSYSVPLEHHDKIWNELSQIADQKIIPALAKAPIVNVEGENLVLLDVTAVDPRIIKRALQLNILNEDGAGVEGVYKLRT